MNVLYQAFGFILFHIYNLVQNYGVAIILFTIIVKTCILPLNIKQTNSMREMQAIQPELTKLQKKYKNNPEKLNQETMKLYKLYKVNPMAGCLPLLIQLPIIWGLYGALREPRKYVFTHGSTVALKKAFLWLPTLADPDPHYIIPILVVALTLLTQWYTMKFQNTGDPAAQKSQKVMLVIMPLMIGWFSLNLPAGIGIYWVVQSAYSFFQTFFVMRKPVEVVPLAEVERRVEEEKAKEKKEKREQRKEMTAIRQEQMNAQMGRPTKKKDKSNRPKTRPASSKSVKSNNKRHIVTKIPTGDERSNKSGGGEK